MALLLSVSNSSAQTSPTNATYPTKPLRIIVGQTAGGISDLIARMVAQRLTEAFKQPAVVENRAGAAGGIGTDMVVKAAPDGYTLFLATTSTMSAVPTMRKNPPFNPVRDFTAITDVGRNTWFMFVHPSLPVRTMPELINHIRANPGKLSYGSISSTAMIATAQLLSLNKLDAVRIPYKGEAPAIPDLITGRIQFGFMTGVIYLQAREGRLRVLATLLPKRSALAPEVPTLEEAGVKGVSTSSWVGLFGPANMPAPLVERLSREFRTALSRPDVIEGVGRLGLLARGSTPAELTAYVKEQVETWNRVLREAGVPLE